MTEDRYLTKPSGIYWAERTLAVWTPLVGLTALALPGHQADWMFAPPLLSMLHTLAFYNEEDYMQEKPQQPTDIADDLVP